MAARPSPKDGRFAVLDIETAPDPEAVALAKRNVDRRSAGGSALHAIAAAAVLEAKETDDGLWTVTHLHSWSRPDDDEFRILTGIEAVVAEVAAADGTLVTYNGIRHDLAVLRRRAARHWMFELEGWRCLQTMRHRDLMIENFGSPDATWPSLRDACAALAIPTNHCTTGASAATTGTQLRKCETDVASTFLLMLHALAMERGSIRPLREGWAALARYAGGPVRNLPHLAQFGRSPLLDVASGRRATDR